jgi:apolipoprotein N-acyltransferase
MPCFLTILALFLPRLVLFLLWLFSEYLHRAFDTVVWPVLGFLLMPYTTLAWAAAQNEAGGVKGWSLALLIVAVLLDLGVISGSKPPRKVPGHAK